MSEARLGTDPSTSANWFAMDGSARKLYQLDDFIPSP